MTVLKRHMHYKDTLTEYILYSLCHSSERSQLYTYSNSNSDHNIDQNTAMAYPESSDSSSSEFTKPQTWSSFTDSDKPINSTPPLPVNPEPPALPSLINSHGSWSPCSSWSTSDWSQCLTWSSSRNSSDQQHDECEDASIHSHHSNQSDQDYVPAAIFNPLVTALNPESETHTSDSIIQPSQAIRMLPCLLFKLTY
jgi:hypothetical protein